MVDAGVLTTDIVETSVYLATPPILWMVLFLLAWGDERAAEESGFGRRSFWLLLPGALVGEFANLPFFSWSGKILAVNIGGGLLPVALSVLLLGRVLGDRERLLAMFFSAFAAVSFGWLAAVFLLPDGPGLDFSLGVIGVGGFLTLWSLARLTEDMELRRTTRNVAGLIGLASLVAVPTFVSTITVPGLGIESAFPWYLLPPIAAGVAAIALAGPLFGLSRRAGLAVGYATATFGVLVGADLLREPPLYSGSGAGLYAIGGAGTSDLLYLSGLLALAAAVVALRFAPSPIRPAPARAPSASLSSTALLRRSLVEAIEGRSFASVGDSFAAAEVALGQAFHLAAAERGRPVGPDAPALLGLPPWVEADRANLAALARRTTLDPADATRAWMTARWLVRFARAASRRCFGSFVRRGFAFALDLLVVTAPAVIVWYYVVARTSGTLNDLLGSVSVNAALFGYTSLALLYFVLLEGEVGTTVGKRLLGLEVRARNLGPAGPTAVLVRNLPKLGSLTLVGVLALFVVILAERGRTISVQLPGGSSLSVSAGAPVLGVLAAALAILGAMSAIAMHFTPERQRLGDLLADTWVVRSPATSGAPAPVAAPSARAPSA